jgi:serine/threonine protein kinase
MSAASLSTYATLCGNTLLPLDRRVAHKSHPCLGEAELSFFPQLRSNTPGAISIAVGSEPSPGYRLRRLRGRGGFAEVWEADAPDGKPVALKFMPSSNASSTSREVRALQAFLTMEHQHLIHINAIWSLPGYIVINMELAEATLLDLMTVYHNDLGQHMDPPLLCQYLWQVARALDFLNTRQHILEGRRVGYQHGDVKPNNILLVGDLAKLTDHGLATPTFGPRTPCPRQGTREYAAPEVFLGYYTDSSDQFSLAVTYYALRTGTLPFPTAPTDPSASYNRPLADLSLVEEAERSSLQRALSPIPQDRFATCTDFMAGILKAHKLKAVREEEGAPWKVVKDVKQDSRGSKSSINIARLSGSGFHRPATPAPDLPAVTPPPAPPQTRSASGTFRRPTHQSPPPSPPPPPA